MRTYRLPKLSQIELKSLTKWLERAYQNKLDGSNTGMVTLLFNSQAIYNKRVIWFGDSFGQSTCPFLSYFFKEIALFRTPFFHREIFDKFQPDYLITANIERYLSNVDLDKNC